MKKSPGKDFWLFFPGEYSLIYVLFFQDLKCTLDLLHAFLITKGTVIQAQIAKYNLLQAIQSYEWVLNGLANAS